MHYAAIDDPISLAAFVDRPTDPIRLRQDEVNRSVPSGALLDSISGCIRIDLKVTSTV